MTRYPIGSTPRFNTWTIIIQYSHMRFVLHCRGLWYCKLCRWQFPIFKGKNVEEVLNGLENVSSNLLQNELKGNASNRHFQTSSGENVRVNISTSQIKNCDCEQLLGIDVDCKLSFQNYINQVCSKAMAKIKALLARIAHFLYKRKRKLLMNDFSNLSLVIVYFHGCFIAAQWTVR